MITYYQKNLLIDTNTETIGNTLRALLAIVYVDCILQTRSGMRRHQQHTWEKTRCPDKR